MKFFTSSLVCIICIWMVKQHVTCNDVNILLTPDPQESVNVSTSSYFVDLARNFTQMMTSLQSSIEYVTKRVQTLEARAASDRHEIDRLQSVIVNITAGRKEVAFSARLSVTKEHMTDGTTVVFDQMISNYGDAYNPRTGIFTCTRTGLYLFSVSLEGHYTDGQGDIPAAITMDGTHLGYLVSDPIKSGQDVQGAVTMVTQVREGQRVWVEVYYRNDVSVFRTFSTFTGVLLS